MPYLGNTPTEVPLSSADLQDGIITTAKIANGAVIGADINSTFDLTGKTVTLPAGVGGKVLQVVQSSYTATQFQTTSTSYVSVSQSASITPSSSSNKVLILTVGSLWSGSNAGSANLTIYRGASNILNTGGMCISYSGAGSIWSTANIVYLDSPSTTSSTTYSIYVKSQSGQNVYYNGNGDQTQSIVLLEIAG
jgi:hypothetical protein